MTGINESEWMGKEARCEINVKEYPQGSGEFSNEINNLLSNDE